MMPENDPVQKISIVPRGMSALGYTMNIPLEDRYLMTKTELSARICGLLGGRIAEHIIFGEISTGAQNDLEKVTGIAYNMVMVYGMSDLVGNLSYYESSNPYSGSPGISKKYSEETAQLIDSEVKAIVEKARQTVTELLTTNRHRLETLAKELLSKEMLQYCQIEEILGKRPEGKYPVHLHTECDGAEAVAEKQDVAAEQNGMSQEELMELEAAVARLKETREKGEP
jgi:cell division protease FtsH